jgi:hypothetical protein
VREALHRKGRVCPKLAYNVAKQGRELKRDLEATLCSEQPAAAGSDSAARKSGAFHEAHAEKMSRGRVVAFKWAR